MYSQVNIAPLQVGVPCSGHQGLFQVPKEVEAALYNDLSIMARLEKWKRTYGGRIITEDSLRALRYDIKCLIEQKNNHNFN